MADYEARAELKKVEGQRRMTWADLDEVERKVDNLKRKVDALEISIASLLGNPIASDDWGGQKSEGGQTE